MANKFRHNSLKLTYDSEKVLIYLCKKKTQNIWNQQRETDNGHFWFDKVVNRWKWNQQSNKGFKFKRSHAVNAFYYFTLFFISSLSFCVCVWYKRNLHNIYSILYWVNWRKTVYLVVVFTLLSLLGMFPFLFHLFFCFVERWWLDFSIMSVLIQREAATAE